MEEDLWRMKLWGQILQLMVTHKLLLDVPQSHTGLWVWVEECKKKQFQQWRS